MWSWIKKWYGKQCFHDWVVIESDIFVVYGSWTTEKDMVCMKCGKKVADWTKAKMIEDRMKAESDMRLAKAREIWDATSE